MDKVHKPEEQCFVSDLINVRDFLEKATAAYAKVANPADALPDEVEISDNPEFLDSVLRSHLAEQLGCEDVIVDELAACCRPEVLLCGDELPEDQLLHGVVEEKPELETLKLVADDIKKRNANGTYKQTYAGLCKYAKWNFNAQETFTESRNLGTVQRVLYRPQDVILTVVLMKPYNRRLEPHEIRLGRLLKPDCCFLVTGQNLLCDLRDRIPCQSDFSFAHDHSNGPEQANPDDFSKEHYHSSFFFIDDTFYNETRTHQVVGEHTNPETDDVEPVIKQWNDVIDLSETIRQFLTRDGKSKEMGPFQTSSMSDTQFIDLALRLGQPYLFLHQGHCEHLIVFTDIRLMALDDPQEPASYPVQIYRKPRTKTTCMACQIYTAKWVTYNNSRLPHEKAFFCETCFHTFNYDDDGNKIGDFVAVPYFDRNALQ